tara:strand:+ start:324 stop:935 length:612 start_codon:yes stop_codon:yes gene_type:complete
MFITNPEKLSPEFIFRGKLRIIVSPKCGSASVYHTLKNTDVIAGFHTRSRDAYVPDYEKTIMVVRDPKQRIISCWKYFCKSDESLPILSLGMAAVGAKKDMSFADFVELVEANLYKEEHFIPQSYYCRNRVIYKYMLTENLTEHWNTVAKAIMPTLPDLLYVNNDKNTAVSYDDLYTADIAAKVEEMYSDDFDLYEIAKASFD